MSERLAIEGGKPVRNIPLPHLYPGAAVYGQEEIDAVTEVIKNQSPFRYYGPCVRNKVSSFENLFAEKFGRQYALAVTSCTASLIVALKAAGIGIGDKVIIPALTFIATAGAVVCSGAVPVFADIDDSYNIDPEKIEQVIDEDTKAIIVVPIQGNPCEMDKIIEIANKHNLIVIEDVAQSIGSLYKNKYSGTFGDIACFSLQLNKIITTGEGGIVITDSPNYYERAARFHDQGMYRASEGFMSKNDTGNSFIGQNYRMSEITGAVALEQLKKLDGIISKMKNIKKLIKSQVQNIDGLRFRRIVDEDGECGSSIMMTLPSAEIGERFRNALNAENIASYCLYGGEPIYMQPQIFNKRTCDKDNFPFNMVKSPVIYTEDMCPYAKEHMPRNAVIGISPLFTNDDAMDIVAALHKVSKHILG